MGDQTEPAARRWRFGRCVLDERSLELTRDGTVVDVDPKPLQVLLHLLEHAGEVVTKDELFEAAWPGREASDATLVKCISRLREAIGDDDQSQVRTQHGFGYRLAVAVQVDAAEVAPAPRFDFKAGDHPPHRPLWTLVERAGSGGHGEVWRVRHDKTGEERVLKFAGDAAALTSLKREITLFRLLRDSLPAGADGYARILDWNLDEPPYFIESELANGGSLPQWSQAQGGLASIPLEQRLELVAQVADALAAAHAVGVLHKDLKPANVLVQVTAEGLPRIRLADFGSGGVIDRTRLRDLGITQLGFTQTVSALDTTSGTPMYLAPEVVAGQPSSVRGDLFALGVLLYQCVHGDFRKPLAPGWERDVGDELLREDIGALVDGDPAARLGDAAEAARRLRSLETRRSTRAAERSRAAEAERLRQQLRIGEARRGLWRVLGGVLALGLVVTGTLGWQAHRAGQREQLAARTAQAVNQFLVEDLVKAADPFGSGRSDTTVREVLDRAAGRVGERFADAPQVAASVHLSLGQSYAGLGDFKKAEGELVAARDGGPPDVANAARAELADVHFRTSRPEAVEQDVAPLLKLPPRDRLRLRAERAAAGTAMLRNDVEGSLRRLDALRPRAATALGADDPLVADLAVDRAVVLQRLGRFEEATAQAREALAGMRRIHGERHVRTIEAMRTLGQTLQQADHADQALATLNEAYGIAVAALGEQHHATLLVATDLALAHQWLKQYDEAERLLRRVLDAQVQVFGEDHEVTRARMNDYAILLGEMGRRDEQLQWFERLYAVDSRLRDPKDPNLLALAHNLARTWQQAGRWERAAALQEKTLPAAREAMAPDFWKLGVFEASYAESLAHLGRRDEARTLLARAVPLLTKALGPEHRYTQRALEIQREVGAD